MKIEPNNIYLGDCLELIKEIPDKYVDMILCDLPYGITACKWDVIIPFEPLWKQYKRIIKDNGAIVLTATQPFTSLLVASNIRNHKYNWIWRKPQGIDPFMKDIRPLNNYEDICVFSRGGTTRYFPQIEKGLPYKIVRDKKPRVLNITGTAMRETETINDGYRYPTRILEFEQEKGLHDTQKPVDLFAYLINTYTLPGELVLDNCCGSGTTAIAAIRTGRDWICMEIDPGYYNIARKRIEAELSQLKLPLTFSEK